MVDLWRTAVTLLKTLILDRLHVLQKGTVTRGSFFAISMLMTLVVYSCGKWRGVACVMFA